ncbi:BREX system ATP-binding domain-containing protein [Luedemannella helvata]
MEFGVLGPLLVVRDGHPVDVGGPKQQALLVLLLVRPNRLLTTGWLVDALWDGRPPASAETTLRTYVAGLRRALEPGRPARLPSKVLPGRPGGYELRVAPATIDATRFTMSVDAARAALDAGDTETAERGFAEALALWRGRALAGAADLTAVKPEVARLTELRLAAEEGRFAAAVAGGRHASVLATLRRFVAEHPTREAARAQLMLALYRDGRQPEALETYEEGRRVLAHEYGLDPGEPLRELHRQILTRTTAAGPAVALPDEPDDDLIGRGDEVNQLNDQLELATAGRGRIAVVSGEPGIGKTSLVRAVEQRATARGIPVVWGRCPEVGQAPPFWVWSRVVRGLITVAGPDGAAADPALAAVSGAAVEPGHAEWDPAARFRLYEAVADLIAAATRERGLLIVLDDLHAADPDSLLLLRFLATTLAATRALVVVTTRPYDHLPDLVAAMGDLDRAAHATRVRLRGLRPDAVRRLVRRERGANPADAYVAELHTRTHGNPFFLTELLRHDPDAGDLPPTVIDAVRARLAALAPAARDCLELLSVAGHELDLHTVATVLDIPTERLVALLSDGPVAQLAGSVGPGLVGFRHPLFAEVAYADLAAPRRAALHARLAGAYERLGTFAVAEIARHYGLAVGLGHGDDHVTWSLRAADEAIRRLAYEDASAHLDRAAAQLATSPARAGAELTVQLRRAALLQSTVGIGSGAVGAACARARELLAFVGPETDTRPALWALAELAANRGEFDICADLAGRIADAPGPPDDITWAAGQYELGVAAFFTGRLAAAEEHLSLAVDRLNAVAPQALGLPALAAYHFRALVRSLRGQRAAARDDIAAAVALAERLDDPYARANAQLFAAWLGMQELDAPATSVAARRCRDLGREHRLPHCVATGGYLLEWAAVQAGDPSRLDALREGYEAIYRPGLRATRTITLSGMATAHLSAGDAGGAARLVDEALAIADETGERVFVAELLRLRGTPADLREAARLAAEQDARLFVARLSG